MAAFKDRIVGLTSLNQTNTNLATDNELSEFLKDGVLDVTERSINAMPQEIQSFQRVSATIDSNGGLDLGGAKIISVLREANEDGSGDGSTSWRTCKPVSPGLQSRVVDPESLDFASIYNPVYMISDNNKINVYPVPDGTDDGYKVYYVNNVPTDETNGAVLTHAHTDIKWFPNSKIYLVVIYASIKALENKMAHLSAVDEDAELVQAISQNIVSLKSEYQSAFGAAPQKGK